MAATNPSRPDRYTRPETGVDPQFLRDVQRTPPLKRSEIYDDGLLIDVKPTGVVTFMWKVYTPEGKRTITLGRFDASGKLPGTRTLKEAHAWKRRLQAAHKAGRLPEEEAVLAESLAESEPARVERSRPVAATRGATVHEVYGRWFASRICAGSEKRRHPEDIALDYKTDVQPRIGHLPIREVTTSQLAEIIENMVAPRYGWRKEQKAAAPVRAGKVLTLLKMLFGYAKRMDYLTRSDGLRIDPAADLERIDLGVEQAKQKTRALTDEEIATLWRALPEKHPHRIGPSQAVTMRGLDAITVAALRFLLVCPVRTGSLLQARVSEFDLDKAVWTSPAEHWKLTTRQLAERNGQPVVVPLSPVAQRLVRELLSLGGGHAMLVPPVREHGRQHEGKRHSPGAGQGALSRALLRKFQLGQIVLPGGPCTPHDFRRTFRTGVARLRLCDRDTAERCLGHVVGGKVERTYDCHEYLDEKRAALDAWGAHVERLVRPALAVVA